MSAYPLLPARPVAVPDGADPHCAPGTRIAGRYRVLRPLGSGGIGRVSLVVDLATGAECALKQLDPAVLQVSPELLHAEFGVLARVRHPSIVAVRELGFTPDGTPFFTMEYVPGLPADRVIEPRDWPSLVRFAVRVAEGLEALHGIGIVHRDLKPSNLLVVPGDDGCATFRDVRIVDFGFAHVLEGGRGSRRGTLAYAAPEMFEGVVATVATDLYAFGVVLAAMALRAPGSRAAVPPARGADGIATRLDDAGAPQALTQLILRLLATAPVDRPADARELREELVRLDPAAARPLAERLATEVVTGRERELARLERLLAADGEAPIAIVTGLAGTGKTALLRALAARASLTGRPVHALSGAGAGVDGVTGALARRLGVAGPAAASGDWNAAEDAATLAGALAGGALVLVDDWDRCDARSRSILRRVALDPAASAARWVWACRAGDDDDRTLLASGRAHPLELSPLDEDGMARLVDARLSRHAPSALVVPLARRSGGNPGFAIALLRAAAAHGALRESEAGITVDAVAIESLAIADGFEPSRIAAWEALPQPARAVVAVLAVVAGPVAAAAPALAVAGGEDALARAAGAGLVERGSDGAWRLVSPGLGDAIAARLGAAERRAAHEAALALPGLTPSRRFAHLVDAGRVGEAFDWAEQVGADDVRIACEAAGLATAAGRADAPRWQLRAGLAELARERPAAAVPYLERARVSLAGDERVACLVALSRACLRAGRAAEVDAVVAEALAAGPTLFDQAVLRINAASAAAAAGQRDAALDGARRALEFARAHAGARAIGAAAQTCGGLLLFARRFDAAADCASEALAAYREAGDRDGETRAAGLVAYVAREQGDRDAADRAFEAAVEVARNAGLRRTLEELLINHGSLLVEAGRWNDACRAFEEAARIALEDGRPRDATIALSNMAQLDGITGRPARARREALAALRLARAHAPAFEPAAWRALSQAERVAGRLGRAARAARRAIAGAVQRGDAHEIVWSRIEYGRICIARGAWREAERVWSQPLEAPAADGADAGRIVLATLAGRAALRHDDAVAARERLREARAGAAAGAGERPYVRAHVLQLAAECAIARVDATPAAVAVREALAAYAALPAPADAAAAAVEFARLAASHSVRVPATELLAGAAAQFLRLGDRRGRERALALAVANARERGGTGADDRALLASVNRMLNSATDVRELVTRAMRELVEQLDAERGVLLLDDGSGAMVPVVEQGAVDAEMRDAAVRYSRGAVEHVRSIASPMLMVDASSDLHGFASVMDLGLRSILCVPIFSRAGQVAGIVYLDSQRARAFDDEDRGLLEGFASLMGNAIERSRGHEDLTRSKQRLEAENVTLRGEVGARFRDDDCIAVSPVMQALLRTVDQTAAQDMRVLLTGENGTGKELIAHRLHDNSPRSGGPFVTVSCSALTDTLLESELFGIKGNVATGVAERIGKFEQAHGGTLFLDEIGDMPLHHQAALLTVLSSRSTDIVITPLGGRPLKVSVRVIAATNRDLSRAIAEGRFREDLFYRLGMQIDIPPLRERKVEIPELARHFVKDVARRQRRKPPELTPAFLATLMRSDWPGNVRELAFYIECAMTLTPGAKLRPITIRGAHRSIPRVRLGRQTLKQLMSDFERRILREALERSGWNQSGAARDLDVSEATLRARMRALDIVKPRTKAAARKKLRVGRN